MRIALTAFLFVLGTLLAIGTAGLLLASFVFGGRRLRWFSVWREIASRYHATVDSVWWLPRMRFRWRDQPVSVRSLRRMGGQRLRGTILESAAPEVQNEWVIEGRHWPGPAKGQEHVPARNASGSDGNLTVQREAVAGTGNSLFDSHFRHPWPGATAPGLSDVVCWQLAELAQWSGAVPLRIEVTRQRIRVLRAGHLKKPAELDDFLRLGLRVIDQLRTVRTEGLEFVNEDQATILDEAFCPICTDRLTGNMVICIRCKTPHCRDCWEYNGKCAMFACTETRYASVGR